MGKGVRVKGRVGTGVRVRIQGRQRQKLIRGGHNGKYKSLLLSHLSFFPSFNKSQTNSGKVDR